MSVEIHIFDKSKRLEPFRVIIERAYIEAISAIEKLIDLPSVDVLFVDNPGGAIPETGVGGNAYTKHFVIISINPDFPSIQENLSREIKSTLAHELHHCARMMHMTPYKTLLAAVITEGLADAFDIEINNTKPKPWSIAIQGAELDLMKKKAKEEFESEQYDYFSWFFGSAAINIPRWAGYSVGFDLVKKYIEKTGKKPSQLVTVSAEEFTKVCD